MAGTKDCVVWALSSTRKSFKMALSKEVDESLKWKLLSVMSVPMKVKCFRWLLLRNKLAISDRLQFMVVLSKKKVIYTPYVRRVERTRGIWFFTMLGFIDCGLGLQGYGVCIMWGPGACLLVSKFGAICWWPELS